MNLPFEVVHDKQLVVARHNPAITRLLPNAKVVSVHGRDYMAVPHKPVETKLLRNLGYDVPPPILYWYDWRGTVPFESQKDTAAILTSNRRAYVLNEIGTGKTRGGLFAFDYLRRAGVADSMLVIAPLSTLNVVWAAEAFKIMPDLKVAVLHGSAKARRKLLRQKADIYVINPAGLGIIKDDLRQRSDINVVIIDELATFRNKRTEQWKQAYYALSWGAGHPRDWCWGLTGAPTPNAPTDAWAQCKLLTPGTVPKFMKQFRDQTMYQVTQYRWLEREQANDIVHKAMQPAIRVTRDQCVDLPPVMYSDREVPLSTAQAIAYKTMMRDLAVQTSQGLITAANEGVKISKLLQIASGFVYGPDGLIAKIDPGARFTVLKELIEETAGKLIVFAPFIETVRNLEMLLAQDGYNVGRVDGSVAPKKRNDIFTDFQSGELEVLVAHPRTMSHGLTLTSANMIVWYLPPNALEPYIQANGRITRPGQTRKQFIVHLRGTPIEKKIYRRLQKRESLQGALLEMFEK